MIKYLGFILIVLMVATSLDVQARPSLAPQNMCISEARSKERAMNMPTHLLSAISVVETGRWSEAHRASFAWPWTVTAEGKGRYFRTKSAAINEVHKLKSRGIRNIDVGCMQINLKYHPKAFANLDDAFTPKINIAYAAKFLQRLHQETGAWVSAAAQYHSRTPKYANKYRKKLVKEWTALKAGKYAYGPVQMAKLETSNDTTRKINFKARQNAKKSALIKHTRPARPSRPDTTSKKYLAEKAKAKAFAASWRDIRLAEYKAKKISN